MDGAFGEGLWTWLSSGPLEVRTRMRSPFAALFGIAHHVLIDPRITLPARHNRVAVALRAELRHPLHVLLGFEIPGDRNARHGRGHVAIRSAAPHRPIAVAGVRREQEPQ